ncbi:MAG TPA: ABC transporter ATP-binding protein [Candidatus Limnocylindria bacterium]|nr:ABC transporter ATP-binding protein [Candidatus Limnocylindria bacterium]
MEVDHVGYRYPDTPTSGPPALDDVTFAVGRGQFVAIAGPSGSGKTTLLRCVAGLSRPSTGTVRLDGIEIDGVPRSMAMVFQDYGRSLFAWMRIRENVALPLRGLGLTRSEREERVTAALSEVGLADAADRYPWQVSGGMQQRVAIARAVAYQPRILLMDEPFASVDAQTRADLQDTVLNVWRAHGSTVLFVTHDIDEAVYLGDRVIVLSAAARLAADLTMGLPRPRDQVDTRASAAFADRRAELARLIMRPRSAGIG